MYYIRQIRNTKIDKDKNISNFIFKKCHFKASVLGKVFIQDSFYVTKTIPELPLVIWNISFLMTMYKPKYCNWSS